MIKSKWLTVAAILSCAVTALAVEIFRWNDFDPDVVEHAHQGQQMHPLDDVGQLKPNATSLAPIDNPIPAVEQALTSGRKGDTEKLIATEAAEMEEWERAHGMPSRDQKARFENYTNDALAAMAEQGDFEAAYEFADRHVREGRYAAAIEVLEVASAYGSSYALIKAARISAPLESPQDMEIEAYKERLYPSLAYFETAVMRGNPYGGTIARSKLSIDGVELSPVDLALIHQQALDNLNHIQQIRQERNLGELENVMTGAMVSLMDTQLSLPSAAEDNNIFLAEEAYISAISQAERELK